MYICIDFDGTIVEHRFPDVGSPVPGALEWMIEFQEAGAKLILFTMRSDGGRLGGKKWCLSLRSKYKSNPNSLD